VSYWLDKHDIPRRPPGGGDPDGRLEDADWLVDAYHERELSVGEIADVCGCGIATVWRRMDSHNIPRRDQPDATPSGEGHWAYKGGESADYGPDWERRAAAVRERDDNRCRVCGRTATECREMYGRTLDVHHITPRSEFMEDGNFNHAEANRLENLISLCSTCHGKVEAGCLDVDAHQKESQ